MNKVAALVHTWLVIDFFGDARRAGNAHGSSLTTTIFTQSFFGFVLAALLYPETPPVPFAAASLCLSTLLMTIGALGDDSRPERRAADADLLHGTPMSRLAIAFARAGHAAFAVMLVTIGMALPPAVLLAFVTGRWLVVPLYLVGACLCSGLATGALGVFTSVATRCLGGARTALLTGTVKALLLGGGLVLFVLGLSRLKGTADAMPLGRTGIELLPPYQVARWLAAPVTDSWRVLVLLGVGAVLVWLGSVFAGQSDVRGGAIRSNSPSRRLLATLTRPGPHRAIAEFVAITMWRSAGFRARVLPLLGMPAAMVLLTLRSSTAEHDFVLRCVLLQLPAIYLPFLVAFLPRADQPGTSWVFAQAPRLSRELVQDATWRALVSHVLLPTYSLAIVLTLAGGRDLGATLAACVFGFGIAVIAARATVRSLGVVPFTKSGDEAGPELGGMFGSALVLLGLGLVFGHSLPPAARWPVAIAIVGLAAVVLRRHSANRATPLEDAVDAPEISSEPAPGSVGAAAKPANGAAEAHGHGEDPTTAAVRAPASLRGELRAIAVLYGFLCVLPVLVGTIFAG